MIDDAEFEKALEVAAQENTDCETWQFRFKSGARWARSLTPKPGGDWEKERDEAADEYLLSDDCDEHSTRDTFREGAQFGYERGRAAYIAQLKNYKAEINQADAEISTLKAKLERAEKALDKIKEEPPGCDSAWLAKEALAEIRGVDGE